MNWVTIFSILLLADQGTVNAAAYFPDKTSIETIRQNGFEKVESKRRYGRGIEKLQFYPVGFSKKGAFAHIIYTDEDVIGLWKMVITDLVHDKQLGLVNQEDPEYNTSLKQFVTKQAVKINKALKKHGIKVSDFGGAGSFPIVDGENKIKLMFLSSAGKKVGDPSNHAVNLYSKQLGQKKIATLQAPAQPHCCKSLGYYKSPFGKRAAILILGGKRGFEGSIVVDITIVGAHLKVGFKN